MLYNSVSETVYDRITMPASYSAATKHQQEIVYVTYRDLAITWIGFLCWIARQLSSVADWTLCALRPLICVRQRSRPVVEKST